MSIQYIEPSLTATPLAASTAYNADKLIRIRDIRADAAGIINITDSANTAITFNVVQGERISMRGKISVVDTSTVAMQIYL